MSADDSLMRDRVRPSSIRALIESAGAEARAETEPAAEELDPLPRPGDAYVAHARPSNKPVITLHCLMGDASCRGFAWANYDGIDLVPAKEPGGGPVLVLRFAGRELVDVVIEGRNLQRLYAYLGQNRIGWIRELPAGRDFREDGTTVITQITIQTPKLTDLPQSRPIR